MYVGTSNAVWRSSYSTLLISRTKLSDPIDEILFPSTLHPGSIKVVLYSIILHAPLPHHIPTIIPEYMQQTPTIERHLIFHKSMSNNTSSMIQAILRRGFAARVALICASISLISSE